MSYTNTFIVVADDCPQTKGLVPTASGDTPTVSMIEYELLTSRPYQLTQDDLIFAVHVTRAGLTAAELKKDSRAIHAKLFAKSHPCMRASALTKRYGWGVHYDETGRMVIYGCQTQQYAAMIEGKKRVSSILKAMRNKRAAK